MTQSRANAGPARNWIKVLADYREPDPNRSVWEVAVTVIPFIALWTATYFAYVNVGYWLAFLVSIPTAFFTVRLFLLQHDCGHYALFKSKTVNDWIGRILGIFTFTPYADWRHSHALHHASHGNLEKRGFGDIDTKTVREYAALSALGRLRYRLYRNPLVMFGIGPAYVFLIRNRHPANPLSAPRWAWMSAIGTNLGIVAVCGAMMWLIGWQTFLIIHLPIIVMAATLGVWMFYVQHQFESTTWEHEGKWDRADAALYGSSHYDLPRVLRWLTANIGVHHVHHLSSVIPCYRLHEVLEDHPELVNVRRLTLWESLSCLRLRLWDEDAERLVSFSEARPAIDAAMRGAAA